MTLYSQNHGFIRHNYHGFSVINSHCNDTWDRATREPREGQKQRLVKLTVCRSKGTSKANCKVTSGKKQEDIGMAEPSNIVESRIQGPKVWILESKVQGPRHGCNPCHTAPTCLFRAFGGLQTTEMVSKRCRKKRKTCNPRTHFFCVFRHPILLVTSETAIRAKEQAITKQFPKNYSSIFVDGQKWWKECIVVEIK